MEWRQLPDENGYRRLAVVAPWGEIEADYQDLVMRCVATVQLPGFRPGKTPRAVIEQRCRGDILADLSARTVERVGREAVRDAGAEALGPLEASDITCARGQPFQVVVRYRPMPEIRLPAPAELRTADDGTDARDRIARRLLDLVPLELPEEVVRHELHVDGVRESAPGSDDWIAAEERVKLLLILKRIARQEGIEVDERDINTRIAEKAEEFGDTAKALRAELEEGGGTTRLRDMLLAECTLDYLLDATRQDTHSHGG